MYKKQQSRKRRSNTHVRSRGRHPAIPRPPLFLTVLALVFAAALSPGGHQAHAAIQSGYSEYYVPGPEEQMGAVFNALSNDAGGGDVTGGGMHCVISVTATGDETTVYYDHWEDGYDFDPDDPDGTCDRKDVLSTGQVMEYVGENIPVSPRGTSVHFDGGDRLYIAGASVFVSRSSWTESAGTNLALSWSLFPVKPFLTDYTIPVGENLAAGPQGYEDFDQTYVLVQSTTDNNRVTIDDPGTAGTDVDVVLQTGQSTQLHNSNSGTRVHAEQPVQVQFVVGSSLTGLYECRGYTAFPDNLWDNEYYNPVSGSDSGWDTDLYVYNPNPYPIIIYYEDTAGTGSFSLDSRGTLAFSDPAAAGRFVPEDSGSYLRSDDIFWAIGSADTESRTYDWGYSLVPANLLTEEYYLPWAPGTSDDPPGANGSPVYVAAVQDETVVFVDFSPTDGVWDQEFLLNRLESVKVFDPDNDNSGMRVFSTQPIALTWGQDPVSAGTSSPYLDLGSTILPMADNWLDLTLGMSKEIDPSVVAPGAGKVSTVTLEVSTYEFPVAAVSVKDILPEGWSYVPNSTTIILPDRTLILGSAAEPAVTGQEIEWDNATLNGLFMKAGEVLSIEFDVVTDASVSQGTVAVNSAVARGERLEGTQIFSPSDNAIINVTAMTIDKDAATPQVASGGTGSYTISVVNISDDVLRDIEIYDALPSGFTYDSILSINESGATRTSTTDPSPGDSTLEWDRWDLAAGGSLTIVFAFNVDTAVEPGYYDNTAYAYSDITDWINDLGTAEQDLGTPSGEDPETDEDVLVSSLTIDKDTSTPTAVIPGVVRYTIAVSNEGIVPITGVTIEDVLQSGFTFAANVGITETSATRTTTTDPVSGDTDLVWDTWSIDPGGSVVVEFEVNVASTVAAGTYDNSALARCNETGPVDDAGSVAQDQGTPSGEDPEDDEDVTLEYRLTVDLDALISFADPDYTTITYRATVENTGAGPLTDVVIRDTLPPGFVLVSTESITTENATRTSTGDPAPGDTVLQWDTWDIGIGGSVVIEFVADTSGAGVGVYDNTLEVDSAQTGTVDDDGLVAQDLHTPAGNDPEDDEDVTIYGQPTADIETIKSHLGSFVIDQDHVFWIEAINHGPSTIAEDTGTHPVTVTDTLPLGLTYVDSSGDGWVVDTSSLPDITWTHPCTGGLAAGESLPVITLVVNPAPAALPSVTNTSEIAVGAPYADPDTSNNTSDDMVTIIGPDLSDSTKDVADVNRGDLNPGDTLAYTITVIESGGGDATGVSVSDDMPANVNNPQIASCPAGAVCAIDPGGANGTGVLTVTGLDVPANGQADIVFTVDVDNGLPAGTVIDNTATITNPNGPEATAVSPPVTVMASQLPASGTKPLYLEENSNLVRTPPAAPQDFIEINNSTTETFIMNPVAQQEMEIDVSPGTVDVDLLMAEWGHAYYRDVYLYLEVADGGGVLTTLGTHTWYFRGELTETMQLFTATMALPASNVTVPAGAWIQLRVHNEYRPWEDRRIRIWPLDETSGVRSRFDLEMNTVINVDRVGFYDAAYPGGAQITDAEVGSTVYIRAEVSDPYGHQDIASALLDVVDPGGNTFLSGQAMAEVSASGATKVFEHAVTIPGNGPMDYWVATVTSLEGTEGTVEHVGVASLKVLPVVGLDLTVFKTHDGPFAVGSTATYTLTVRNSGTEAETDPVRVTDTLPADLVYVASSGSGWTVDTSALPLVEWTYPVSGADPLDPGESLPPIELQVDVLEGAYPSIDNTATVWPVGGDVNPANDSETDTAVVTRLDVTKVSDATDPLYPGDTVNYTVTVSNTGLAPATNIVVKDPLALGTTYTEGSMWYTSPKSFMRVTEYYLGDGVFNGTAYDLALDQDLAQNYFVILQGSSGEGTGGGHRGPDSVYAGLTADPFGTGDLGNTGQSDVIRIERETAEDSWVGVVTVVESLSDHDTAGFRLLDVQEISYGNNDTGGTDNSSISWTDIDQVLLMGGANGAGCRTNENSNNRMSTCYTRLWPSGSDTINWSRSTGEPQLRAGTSTVMVVEWGSEWTVQRARVQGNNGGNGVDAAGEYDTASLGAPVTRANTWVWATGHTDTVGIGEEAEGVVATLGDGVSQNATEDSVAVGAEYEVDRDFEVYVMTHPNLTVDHRFKPDGDGGDLISDVDTDSALSQRMALSYNTCNGQGAAYPRPVFSARYLDADTIRLERRRSGQAFAAWVQGIDFSAFTTTQTVQGNAPMDLLKTEDGVSLGPGDSATITYQVTVDSPPDPGPAVNTAYVFSADLPDPVSGSVSHTIRSIPVVDFTDAEGNPLQPGDEYNVFQDNETVHLKVYDLDRNTDSEAVESITVIVTSPAGDSEEVVLYETGVNTGIFAYNQMNYRYELPLDSDTNVPNDGRLYVTPGSTVNISLAYADTEGDPAVDVGSSTAFLVTRAVISEFGVYVGDNGPVVFWETSSENRTLGFFPERWDVREDRWLRVRPHLVPGFIGAPQGGSYHVADPEAPATGAATYRLVELEAGGGTIVHGPYEANAAEPPVDAPVLADGMHRAPHRRTSPPMARRTKGGTMSVLSDDPPPPGDMVRIAVDRHGLYRVSATEVAPLLGMSEQEVRDLMSQNGMSVLSKGRRVPLMVEPDGAAMYFHGTPLDTVYSDSDVYWLVQGPGLPMAPASSLGDADGSGSVGVGDAVAVLRHLSGAIQDAGDDGAYLADMDKNGAVQLQDALQILKLFVNLDNGASQAPASSPGQPVHAKTTHHEQELFAYTDYTDDPGSDYWGWACLYSGSPGYDAHTAFFDVSAPAPDRGDARLGVSLKGLSAARHLVRVEVNGTEVGSAHVDGMASGQTWFDLDMSLLAEGENSLTLTALVQDEPYQAVVVDSFDISYPRYLEAESGALRFTGVEADSVTVTGFPSPDIRVLDLSRPDMPMLLDGRVAPEEGGTWSVSFGPVRADREYRAVCLDLAETGTMASGQSPADLMSPNNAADWVAIAPRALVDELQILADHREVQGLLAMVVSYEDVCNLFGFGVRGPDAIRNFLAHAAANWSVPPRYLLLAGDGTYDYKGNLPGSDNLIPPLMAGTPKGLFASDNLFVDLDGDRMPDLAVGRLPVSNAAELAAVVEKILRYETGAKQAWQRRVILAADQDAGADRFTEKSARIAELLPPALDVDTVYLADQDLEDAREDLISGIRQGAFLVNYIGHGGFGQLSGDPQTGNGLLTSQDVPLLDNTDALPVLAAFTCVVGRFEIPDVNFLSESLVNRPDGGAIAVWSTAGLSLNEKASVLARKFARAVFLDQETRVGDAVLSALDSYRRETGDTSMPTIYNLFGDPALELRLGAMSANGIE